MESIKKRQNMQPAWFVPYAPIRTDSYMILASLLDRPPSPELLNILRNLAWEEGIPANLAISLEALRGAGCDISLPALEDEFNRLFVGLGRGEMIPYASWYRERKIQSRTLASLRTDLMLLGIVREGSNPEPEDHAGTLCEIMALISRKQNRIPPVVQAKFFQEHLVSWIVTFFQDLQSATKANFYRAVGMFGACFLKYEDEYLRNADDRYSLKNGGLHNDKRTFQQPTGLS